MFKNLKTRFFAALAVVLFSELIEAEKKRKRIEQLQKEINDLEREKWVSIAKAINELIKKEKDEKD